MASTALGDMQADEFREQGHRLVDWLADYFRWSLGNPVLSRVRPGAIRAELPAAAPETSEPFDRILEDFERILVPGLTQWHPAGHERAPEVRTRGLSGRGLPAFRVYCSEHAHSSVDKAVITLGLGHENLRRIPVDAEYRLRADRLEAAVEEDSRAGHVPLAVI